MSFVNSLQTALSDTALTFRAPTWDVEAALRELEEQQAKDPSKRNKVAVLTGGSAGIGTEILKGLARGCERVYIFGRSPSRNQAAIDALPTAEQRARCQSIECDLSSLASIRKSAGLFFDAEKGRLGGDSVHIDVFVGNAGLMNYDTKQKTKDGWESMWGTNALGHHALIHHLLPAFAARPSSAEPPRIVLLSSGAHAAIYSAESNFYSLKDRLASDLGKGSFALYGRSKAANILDQKGWERYFTEQAASTSSSSPKPIIVSVHPGAIRSELGRSYEPYRLLRYARITMHRLICWPAAPYGSTNTLWAAMFATREEVDGKYVQPWCDTRVEPTLLCKDERLAREHWHFMEELVKAEQAGAS